MSSWHTYPQIFNMGHRYVKDILTSPVLVEEKVDGSQFSFGVFVNDQHESYMRVRSKGAELTVEAPEKMFKAGVDWVKANMLNLTPGYTYRGEYLAKPKHNALAYDRAPKNNIIIFDINDGEESYLEPSAKSREAERIGLEVVPHLYAGMVSSLDQFRDLLARDSVLGGQKIEGVVVKNYSMFGLDKKALMGKFVSEAFKEVHQKSWSTENPAKQDVVQQIIETYRSPARWQKAVIHLRERGLIEDSPKDIGLLFKEVWPDILKEEEQAIKDKLFAWAQDQIRRGVTGGMPEWYKEQLLLKQFEGVNPGTMCPPGSISGI
jgi:RNA ligase-like protein